MADKTILLSSGKEIKLKNTFRTARMYREVFKKDMLADMQRLAVQTSKKDTSDFDFQILEQVCYIMAKHGMGDEIGDIDNFCDYLSFADMSILMSALAELWNMNTATTVVRTKK
jgi:hypothetical protein